MHRTANGDFDNETVSYSYRIAKASQNMLTICLGKELKKKGVKVCAIHPGIFVPSAALDEKTTVGESAKKIIELITLNRSELNGQYIDILSGKNIEW